MSEYTKISQKWPDAVAIAYGTKQELYDSVPIVITHDPHDRMLYVTHEYGRHHLHNSNGDRLSASNKHEAYKKTLGCAERLHITITETA